MARYGRRIRRFRRRYIRKRYGKFGLRGRAPRRKMPRLRSRFRRGGRARSSRSGIIRATRPFGLACRTAFKWSWGGDLSTGGVASNIHFINWGSGTQPYLEIDPNVLIRVNNLTGMIGAQTVLGYTNSGAMRIPAWFQRVICYGVKIKIRALVISQVSGNIVFFSMPDSGVFTVAQLTNASRTMPEMPGIRRHQLTAGYTQGAVTPQVNKPFRHSRYFPLKWENKRWAGQQMDYAGTINTDGTVITNPAAGFLGPRILFGFYSVNNGNYALTTAILQAQIDVKFYCKFFTPQVTAEV